MPDRRAFSPIRGTSSRPRVVVFAALLAIATLLAYLPALRGGFVWDDDAHVTRNLNLRTLDGLRRIWLEPTSIPQYYPLVHTTFWIEHQLWGVRPAGYHAVNVLLHAANAILVGVLLRRLRVPGAWLAAAIFALHPVHVESVAWITERKNVLSTFFYLAAALAFVRFFGLEPDRERDRGGWRAYAAGCALFLCALAGKTVTASLPAALGLVLVWKRRRLTAAEAGALLPLVAAGAALGGATIWLERHHVGAEGPAWQLGFADRIAIAGRAAWFYVAKLIWPSRLSFVYPRWDLAAAGAAKFLPAAAALGALAALWAARRRIGAGPLVATLFFWGTLVPALGFFNVFPMRYAFVADHFQYLASIGAIALLAAAAATAVTRAAAGPSALGAASAATVLLLMFLGTRTYQQSRQYRDAETLWRATLATNPAAAMAHNNLGLILARRGDSGGAIDHYRAALAANPLLVEAEYNLANALLAKGDAAEALAHFEHATTVAPGDPLARYNYGIALIRLDRPEDAIGHLEAAVRAAPGLAEARAALAFALGRRGRDAEAAAQALEALRLDPNLLDTRRDLADVLIRSKRFDEAAIQLRAILAAEPADERVRFNLGLALQRAGRTMEAVAEFDELLRRNPEFAAARRAREQALAGAPTAPEPAN